MSETVITEAANSWSPRALAIGLCGLIAALTISYWHTWRGLLRDWRTDENYSVGALVPPIAVLFLFAILRHAGSPVPSLWGVMALVLAQGVRLIGVLLLYESIERYSIILTVAAVLLLVGGWRYLRLAGPVLAFLLLMVPFPNPLHNLLALPLQNFAANGAVSVLEVCGADVVRDGHDLRVGRAAVSVAEGCSGLRMLTATLFIAGVFALAIRRPVWHKLTLLIFALPIAVVTNVMRVVGMTGIGILTESTAWLTWSHDIGGFLMMPIALGLLWCSSLMLDRVFISAEQTPREEPA